MSDDLEVVWSGTLERAAREQAVRAAESATPHRKPCREDIVALLRANKAMTMPELARAIGCDQHWVNGAIYPMKKSGEVRENGKFTKTAHGRLAAFYELTEERQ